MDRPSPSQSSDDHLRVGAAQVNITPKTSQFLFGYPHEPRMSTGVHDPLYASAMYLNDGRTAQLFVGCDVIWVPPDICKRVSQRIAKVINVSPDQIMITATHTHSAPHVAAMISNQHDPTVPPPDPDFREQLENGILQAARLAQQNAQPAELGLVIADASMVGTNRRDPNGPSLPKAPLLVARNRENQKLIGLQTICTMHPTVLHEDSKLISGDFPGLCRAYLQSQLAAGLPVVWHMGASGNQSPRHVTRSNTFEEAKRLGEALGRSMIQAMEKITWRSYLTLDCLNQHVDLSVRDFPSPAQAGEKLENARARFQTLHESGADRATVRTAECDWFGAEETLTLAKAAASGRLAAVAQRLSPARVAVFTIGPWKFVGWPGECFVEFALAVRQADPLAFVMTLVGGDLEGYVVTQQAVNEGGYEASNAIFQSPQTGEAFVAATCRMLESLSQSGPARGAR